MISRLAPLRGPGLTDVHCKASLDGDPRCVYIAGGTEDHSSSATKLIEETAALTSDVLGTAK